MIKGKWIELTTTIFTEFWVPEADFKKVEDKDSPYLYGKTVDGRYAHKVKYELKEKGDNT